jgi:isopentenyldiphosphate isomerase
MVENMTPWGWPNEFHHWNWLGNEGKPMKVRVFTKGDKVKLTLHGMVIAEAEVNEHYIAEFEIPFEPGRLEAIAYKVGNVIGKATRGECHSGSKLLHPVVHLHVFNSKGQLYLQRRPDWKDIQPGKWDTAVGGHIDYGETPQDALRREVREELGITDFVPEAIDKYVFESAREKELVYVNRTIYDGEIRPSAQELDGGRFWTLQEISEAMGKGILTPNFENEFNKYKAIWHF